MRGIYTCGVLDTFLDEKIKVDGIIGVSAGALFGIDYCSKQKGRIVRFQKKYVKEKDYMGLRPFLKTGNVINRELAYYDIPRKYDLFDEKAFESSGIDFYTVITNVNTGKAEYVKITNTVEQTKYFEATSAMPFATKMVEIGNEKYLDGALADSIPITKFQEMAYDKIIVILTKPYGYRKKKPPEFLAKKAYKEYPNLVNAINTRYLQYNASIDKIDKLEKEKKIFVLRPSKKIKIGRIEKDPEKIQEMYNLGISDAKERLTELKEFLSAKV